MFFLRGVMLCTMPTENHSINRLTLFRPEGAASGRPHDDGGLPLVLVCPGGGYARRAEHEADPVARWATSLGFAAAVLEYRVAPEAGFPNSLDDALDAVRNLRAKKAELGLTGRIAVLGFSAGGHVAASLSVHGCHDPATRVDASVLIYPVITMRDPFTHAGSRTNLLGANPSPQMIEKTSNERQVSPSTPPAFLIHGLNDTAVPVENTLLYAEALKKHGIPHELHIFPDGPHGFGMGTPPAPVSQWPTLAGIWLRNVL